MFAFVATDFADIETRWPCYSRLGSKRSPLDQSFMAEERVLNVLKGTTEEQADLMVQLNKWLMELQELRRWVDDPASQRRSGTVTRRDRGKLSCSADQYLGCYRSTTPRTCLLP